MRATCRKQKRDPEIFCHGDKKNLNRVNRVFFDPRNCIFLNAGRLAAIEAELSLREDAKVPPQATLSSASLISTQSLTGGAGDQN